MVFVTVGSQKFQFDRLIRAVDSLAISGEVEGGVFVQTGACTYVPEHCESVPFLSRGEFTRRMGEADVVVTHAGTGAIVGAVKLGKKVIAVPRLAKFGEHVDNHQVEIVQQFARMRLIEPCYDPEGLVEAYRAVLAGTYLPYESNSARFVADLEEYLDLLGGTR